MAKLNANEAINARRNYFAFAIIALFLGLLAVYLILMGHWGAAVMLYGCATASRLLAGAIMNAMDDAEVVNAWNDRYHRKLVIALNAGVGAVLFGKLWWVRWDFGIVWGNQLGLMEARWFLTIAIALYLVASRFTRPNTFGARLRSAILTVVLIGVMAHLAWPGQWGLWVLMGVIVLNITMLRLRALQRRFGWAER